MLVTGTIIDRRYRVGRKVGSGSMGTVFEAEHVLTGQRVALKVLHQGADSSESDIEHRFVREARLSATLDHDHIVKVLDAGRDDEREALYIAMELLRGDDLEQRLSTLPTTRRQALEWVLEVLPALAAAHDAGVVHRDLKPGNLFLSEDVDGTTRVKLLDFGIARNPEGTSVTREGVAVGTPIYMSPEQAMHANRADRRSDLWSIGVILYEIATGSAPFNDGSVHALVMRAMAEPHVPLEDHVPDIDLRLARLVDRCLAKEPAERPADVSEVATVLESVLREPGAWIDELIHPKATTASTLSGAHRERPDAAPVSIQPPVRSATAFASTALGDAGWMSRNAAVFSNARISIDAEADEVRLPMHRGLWVAALMAVLFVGVVGVSWWLGRQTPNIGPDTKDLVDDRPTSRGHGVDRTRVGAAEPAAPRVTPSSAPTVAPAVQPSRRPASSVVPASAGPRLRRAAGGSRESDAPTAEETQPVSDVPADEPSLPEASEPAVLVDRADPEAAGSRRGGSGESVPMTEESPTAGESPPDEGPPASGETSQEETPPEGERSPDEEPSSPGERLPEDEAPAPDEPSSGEATDRTPPPTAGSKVAMPHP